MMRTPPPAVPLDALPREQPIKVNDLARSMALRDEQWAGQKGRLRLRRKLLDIDKGTPVLVRSTGPKYVMSLNALERAWAGFGRKAVETDDLRERVTELEAELSAETKRRVKVQAELRSAVARQRQSEVRIADLERSVELAVRTFREASRQWFLRNEPESGVHRVADERAPARAGS